MRSNTKPEQKRSGREIKRARQELRQAAAEAAAQKPTGFVFFDADPDFQTSSRSEEFVTSAELVDEAPTKKSGGLLGRFGRKGETEEVIEAPPDPDIRSVQFGGGDSPADEFELAAQHHDANGEDAGSPENAAATELLSRLQEHEDVPMQDHDFAESPAPPPQDPNEIWLPPTPEDNQGPTPIADPTSPAAQPPPRPAPVPVGQVAPPRVAPPETPPPVAPVPAGVPQADIPAPVPMDTSPPIFVSEKELRAQGPADQDDTGNWVPPTLRGIAPKETREATELPRRRRSEG